MVKRAQGLIPWALFCVLLITGVTEFSIWAAVTLDGLSIDSATISLWALISFMLMLLMGGWVWRRRVE